MLENMFHVGCCVMHVVVKVVWDAAVAWDKFVEGLENKE